MSSEAILKQVQVRYSDLASIALHFSKYSCQKKLVRWASREASLFKIGAYVLTVTLNEVIFVQNEMAIIPVTHILTFRKTYTTLRQLEKL